MEHREIDALRAELSEKAFIIEQLKEDLESKKRIIEEKDKTIQELNSRLSQAYHRLNQILCSKTWRIGQFYGRICGVESGWRQRLSKLRKKRYQDIPETQKGDQFSDPAKHLYEFLSFHSDKEEIYLIFCPTNFQNIGGQRGVRLTQELALLNKPVVYIRSLQHHLKDEVNKIEENVIEFPLNWFIPISEEIIASPLIKGKKKVMIFQITFYSAFEIVSSANAHGWVTIYDVIDDWEEFYRENFITEYDRDIEQYVANNADIILAVNQSLQEKFRNFGDVVLLPNGYSPDILKDAKAVDLAKGTITAGFFGFLHTFRFDWDLLIKVARQKRDWMFHIIGFGEPAGLSLPENVLMIGPVDPSNLSGYTKNWDVAIIPYRNNELCRKLNPIKIFEYLYLGLPIVATGCEDVTNYPYTYFANGEEEFIRSIQEASRQRVDKDAIAGLLRESTWMNRAATLLNVIHSHYGFKEACIGI